MCACLCVLESRPARQKESAGEKEGKRERERERERARERKGKRERGQVRERATVREGRGENLSDAEGMGNQTLIQRLHHSAQVLYDRHSLIDLPI